MPRGGPEQPLARIHRPHDAQQMLRRMQCIVHEIGNESIMRRNNRMKYIILWGSSLICGWPPAGLLSSFYISLARGMCGQSALSSLLSFA